MKLELCSYTFDFCMGFMWIFAWASGGFLHGLLVDFCMNFRWVVALGGLFHGLQVDFCMSSR
jgi:hypothetical protein